MCFSYMYLKGLRAGVNPASPGSQACFTSLLAGNAPLTFLKVKLRLATEGVC